MDDDPSKSPSKGCWNWLTKELRFKKELLPIKIVTFLYQGGIVAYMPYLTLHMMGLGITMSQIAFIYACMPIASLIGPPLAGILADRFGNYKLVLMFCMFMTAGLHHMLLAVPYSEPERISLSCGPSGYNLTWDNCHQCMQSNNYTTKDINLQDCKFTCEEPDWNADICFSNDTCLTYNSTQMVSFNISIGLASENESCVLNLDHINPVNQSRQQLSCSNRCQVNCQISEVPECVTKEFSEEFTFWSYFIIRILGTFFLGPCFTMLDASALALAKQHGGDFGKQKIPGIVGAAIMPLLSGILVDYHSHQLGYQEYMLALYMGNGLIMIGVISLAFMTVQVETQPANFWVDLKKLVSRLEIDIFLVMMLLIGTFWGFIEMFLFILLKELKAPNYLMGLTITVGFGVSIPFLFVADTIVEKMGRPVIFTMSFFMYGIRLIGYSLITNPWMCFPFELLEVLTFQLTWVAAVTYCPVLAPKGLLATMTGLIGATHYSIGRGVGTFLGGLAIAEYGISTGFQIFGYIAIGSGVFYALLHHSFLKGKTGQDDNQSIEKPWKEVGSILLSADGDAYKKQENTKLQQRLNTIDSKCTSNGKGSEGNLYPNLYGEDDAPSEEQSVLIQRNGTIISSSDSNNCV